MSEDNELHWNEDAATCARCGQALAPHTGYRVYELAGEITLCPPCYRRRLAAD